MIFWRFGCFRWVISLLPFSSCTFFSSLTLVSPYVLTAPTPPLLLCWWHDCACARLWLGQVSYSQFSFPAIIHFISTSKAECYSDFSCIVVILLHHLLGALNGEELVVVLLALGSEISLMCGGCWWLVVQVGGQSGRWIRHGGWWTEERNSETKHQNHAEQNENLDGFQREQCQRITKYVRTILVYEWWK